MSARMTLADSPSAFGLISRLFHWLTALAVLAMITVGIYMAGLPLSPTKFQLYGLHKSIGMTVLVLTLLRLVWRRRQSAPEPLSTHAPWERILAKATHHGLYALLIALPLVGWIGSSAAGYSVSWFGLFTFPDLVAESKVLQDALTTVHVVLAWVMIVALVMHIGGALKHHVIDRDITLRRMLPLPGAKESL